jgi:phage baseplate assembly protein W
VDPSITPPSLQVTEVVWLDINTLLGEGFKQDLLPNILAINNSIYNLFRCPIGARGPIFQPDYGTSLQRLLHEPLDFITAHKIRMVSIQALQRWEPRIDVDVSRSKVEPDFANAAFRVTIYYNVAASGTLGVATYLLNRN